MIGRTLSHYRILEKLGSGGMGEVYVAEDTKLSRKVALKVLPEEMATEERLSRFEREAKAIAALNHPNIVTAFSVEEAEGVHFITMELVRGKTLAELLPKNGFPLGKFFDIAIPLSDAVAAAHQEGITHRDLKPDNAMVSADGRVKVLDFGLAKPTDGFAKEFGSSELPTVAKTTEGSLVGTLNYMSPEQAQGKPLDARSDIFSLGIIFYEMLTGSRPFAGETPAEVLSSIIKDTPRPLTRVGPQIPRDLSRIVHRCLVKERSRRFQTALDVRNELEELRADEAARVPGVASSAPAQGSKLRGSITVLVAVIIGATLGYAVRPSLNPVPPSPRLTRPFHLTSMVGVEAHPSWSPDGSRIAFAAGAANSPRVDWDVWVTQASGGPAVNLTEDLAADTRSPRWSPDGDQIAFVSDIDGGGCFVMPALGGPPRKIASSRGLSRGATDWSPDGEELACLVGRAEDAFVQITHLASGAVRDIPLPTGEGVQTPTDFAWSPDGRFLAYVLGAYVNTAASELWLLRFENGQAFQITDPTAAVHGPSWGTDGSLYYVTNRGGSRDLWRQRLQDDGTPAGGPEAVTVGIEMNDRAVFSPDGSTLAYSRGGTIAHLWRIPILPARRASWADAERLNSDEAFVEFVNVSPDGERVAFSSDRSGNHDIWLMPSEGGAPQRLTTHPAADMDPNWSPDGKELVFLGLRGGTRDIWIVPVDGGPTRRLTDYPAPDWGPKWSPDGESIIFYSDRSAPQSVWLAPARGGEPKRLFAGGHPEFSPDGRWIAYRGDDSILRVSADGGLEEELVPNSSRPPRWSPDGDRIFYANPALDDIWAVSVEDKRRAPVTDLKGRRGRLGELALDTDGTYLYFTWHEDKGDIWVMDVVTKEEE